MRDTKSLSRLSAALGFLTAVLIITSHASATEKKLHNFQYNGTDGFDPYVGVVFDAAGNLYGTTYAGGDHNAGTVYELTPNGNGGWTEKKLHDFNYNNDGFTPEAGLVFDAAGNLYGTTLEGGDFDSGTLFELIPNASGGWTFKKLHSFGSGTDGVSPLGGLVFDVAGNLYGTTLVGGAYGHGTAFELTPNGNGGWTEKKLHNFGHGTDGAEPNGSLIFDAAGSLYGTTSSGGDYRDGTVFELTPSEGGRWTEKKLHNFNSAGTDGFGPSAGLIFDAAGNLYGTTFDGGNYRCDNGHLRCGTVFELTPNGNGGWREKKLHNFGHGTDGAGPNGSLIFDAAGNLYGTTSDGGDYSCDNGLGCGTVFEMTPNGSGGWTEKKLHTFHHDNRRDGYFPNPTLIFDAAGNLYGTTGLGGDYNRGTVFEITP